MRIGIIIALCMAFACTSPVERKTLDLKANVIHNDSTIVISNGDDFAYKNLEIKLNDSYRMSGLTIPPQATYTAAMFDFTDSMGNRFTPATIKAKKVVLYCETGQEKKGTYVEKFE